MVEECPRHQLYEEGGEVGSRSGYPECQALHCLLLLVENLSKELATFCTVLVFSTEQ